MAKVGIYQLPGHPRSRAVCVAMSQGILKAGDTPMLTSSAHYRSPADCDVAVFYGLASNNARMFRDFKALKKPAVYIDLGYWGRREGGRLSGYHKISVGARHPTAYFQKRHHDASRLNRFGLRPQPWRQGDAILLAGMGPKAAGAEGFDPNQWETWAVAELRKATERPILYRPKPNWETARKIAGTTWAAVGKDGDIGDALEGVWAVVSHHSNANVEALQLGVPSFTFGGVALPLSESRLSKIESPLKPDFAERCQWLADIAWTQWSVAEMAEGAPWRHLKEEGLVP